MKKFIFTLIIVFLLFISGCSSKPFKPDIDFNPPEKEIPFDIYKYLKWDMIMSSRQNVIFIQHSYYDKDKNIRYTTNGHGYITEGSDGRYYVWTAFHVIARGDFETVNKDDNFLGIYKRGNISNVYTLKPIAYEKEESDIAVLEIISVMSPDFKEVFPFKGGKFSKENNEFSHVFNLKMGLPYVGISTDTSGYVSVQWSPIESSATQPSDVKRYNSKNIYSNAFTTPVKRGTSGSPVFNNNGDAIGIISSSNPYISYFVHFNFIEKWANENKLNYTYEGVKLK